VLTHNISAKIFANPTYRSGW